MLLVENIEVVTQYWKIREAEENMKLNSFSVSCVTSFGLMWKIQFPTFEIGLFASSPLDCLSSLAPDYRRITKYKNLSDPMISVTLMVSHFHISSRKEACCENNFEISFFRCDTLFTRQHKKATET